MSFYEIKKRSITLNPFEIVYDKDLSCRPSHVVFLIHLRKKIGFLAKKQTHVFLIFLAEKSFE